MLQQSGQACLMPHEVPRNVDPAPEPAYPELQKTDIPDSLVL